MCELNWISINERLPEESDANSNGDILVYVPYFEGVRMESYKFVRLLEGALEDGEERLFTHFAKVPDGPKIKEEKQNGNATSDTK